VAEARRGEVFDALLQVAWDDARSHAQLTALLLQHASDAATGPLFANAALVDSLCEGEHLEPILMRIGGLHSDDPWISNAQATLAAGAPGSARLAFELQRRCADGSLADAYRLEFIAALHAAAHGDFAEGIRALLIDKDRSPRWQPATAAEAGPAWAQTFFQSPWPAAEHPLADLGVSHAQRTHA